MKFFTKKSVVQKIVIALLLVISFNFSVPVKVQADAGGTLVSPVVALVTVILDQVQHLLEWAMIGETTSFIKEKGDPSASKQQKGNTSINIADLNNGEKELKFDGEIWGIGDYGIPNIQYTPEEIFSNRVPALDINFISPSVSGNDERNVAIQLKPVISSWYTAIRTLALVGLLSVLVYLGIRMLLTSVAADKAKYKKMLWDWLVAMCLVFALHYIMSFALTMAETVTSMISSDLGETISVAVPDGTTFNTNLMGFVRFMIQCTDLQQKLTFLVLYLMLIIYNIRFTWTYLKRVANMAFLTLIAPVVALTYPIDKVSDGKAQAFDMWIKEFSYNALLQPLHLFIYMVLVGSAVQLAVNNPLYAIVCLGFIIAAEKLLKKMFRFDKASGGTLGSLAGAAGVTAAAGKALNTLGNPKSLGGGKGKVRTKDIPEREGKDKNANAPFGGFANRTADQAVGAGLPIPEDDERSKVLSPEEQEKWNNYAQEHNQEPKQDTLDDLEQQRAELYNQGYTDNSDEIKDINEKIQNGDFAENPTVAKDTINNNEPNDLANLKDRFKLSGEKEYGLWDTMKNDTGNILARGKDRLNTMGSYIGKGQDKQDNRERLKRNLKNSIGSSIRRNAIGAWKAAPTAAYKAARGTLKTASRVALGAAMGGLGLAIGATTGDADKAISMALGAGGVGLATGDNLFEATAGRAMKDKSVQDAFGSGKYGNATDARNARADKEYLRSDKFDRFYEKNFKGKNDAAGKAYSKKRMQEIVKSYRQAGITSEKDIKNALKLEDKYRKENTNLSEEDCRAQVQNIVQTYNSLDDKRAFSGNKEAKQAMIDNIAGLLDGGNTANNKKIAEQIFQGYVDFRNT